MDFDCGRRTSGAREPRTHGSRATPIPNQALTTAAGATLTTRATRLGLLLGGVAVLFWSFGSSLIFLGAKQVGTWPFVAIASLVGGGAQLIGWRFYRGEWRSAFCLPGRLWAVTLLCFVVYGLVWPWALVSSSAEQVFGVSLINYLWPVLTVLFGAWWVPGARLTPRTVLAVALALVGLVCANLRHIHDLLAAGGGAGASRNHQGIPVRAGVGGRRYLGDLFGAAGALARLGPQLCHQSNWLPAHRYHCRRHHRPHRERFCQADLPGDAHDHLLRRGPLAVGYLLWEIALPKARVHDLSILAAATPVLSTFLLCLFLRTFPGPELVVAAFLVGGGGAVERPGVGVSALGANRLRRAAWQAQSTNPLTGRANVPASPDWQIPRLPRQPHARPATV